MTKKIGFYVFPDFLLLDLAGPLAAFQMANRLAGAALYRTLVCSVDGGLVQSSAGLPCPTEKLPRAGLDTLIVSGGAGALEVGEADAAALRRLRARRIASVCTGAFVLARSGLLDGRRATTHWRHAGRLQREHPQVRVDGEQIYIVDGPLWTSAGGTACIDLALRMIEADAGRELARQVAQELVVYYQRPGGQSQFSALLALAPESDRIAQTLGYAREHLTEDLSVERLAALACLSPRQFGRLFKQETGETPARAVERIRAEVARELVEDGREPVELIAAKVGFHDPERMRRAFLRRFGHPPQALRRMRAQAAPQPA